MKYYRQLEIGEKCHKGDVFAEGGKITARRSGCGETVTNLWYDTLRPVEVDEWISVDVARPTEKDGNSINVLLRGGGLYLWCWNFTDLLSDPATHWRRITPPKSIEPPLTVKVGETDEIVQFKDGYLQIGCSKVKASPEVLRKIADKLEGK